MKEGARAFKLLDPTLRVAELEFDRVDDAWLRQRVNLNTADFAHVHGHHSTSAERVGSARQQEQ